MIQLVSYNFSTVEATLSDGGNFSTISDTNFTGTLKVIAGNLCEPTTVGTASGTVWTGTVPTTTTWPNDQYSELTLTTFGNSTDVAYVVVRQGSPTSGTQYLANLTGAGSNITSVLFAIVAGTAHTLATHTGLTVAAADVWRLTVAGNLLTFARNGTTQYTFTDTNNFITSGSPGFGLNATTAITTAQTGLWAAGATVPSSGGNSSWLTVALANSLRGVRH